MRKSSGFPHVNRYPQRFLSLLAVLAAAGCATDYVDQPVITGQTDPAATALSLPQGSLLKPSGAAGFTLVTHLDQAALAMRVRLDGLYLVASDAPPVEYVEVMSQGTFGSLPSLVATDAGLAYEPGGFPAGTHTLALEREDGSLLVSTTQTFVAGAYNTVVVYGDAQQPAVAFFADATPSDPSARLVRVMNLTTTKAAIVVNICLGAPPCAPQSTNLAFGESWVATLAASDAEPVVNFPKEAVTVPLRTLDVPYGLRRFFFGFLGPSSYYVGPGHS